MFLKNDRNRVLAFFLASSLCLQTFLPTLAAETNTDFGEIPIASDMVASATTVVNAAVEPESSSTESDAEKELNESATSATEILSDKPEASSSPATAPVAITPVATAAAAAVKENESTVETSIKTDECSAPDLVAQTPLIAQDDRPALRGDASVSPSDAVGIVDDMTKKILLKEIELQKYNLHYTMEVAKQGRWKGWRYAFMQELNAGCGLSGSIISTVNRGQALEKASRVKLRPQLAANYIPMIGSIIGASAAAGEFGINAYHEMIARTHGFSPTAAVRKVTGLKNEIDALIAKRDSLIQLEGSDPSLQGHVIVDTVEGRILKDVRDQALQEFERFHIGARKTIAFQQSQYLFDVSKYVTNAIGCQWAFLSLQNRHRIWNGRAGIMFAVSGQLTCFAPILSRVFAKGYGEFTKHGMHGITKDAQEASVAKLTADLKDLDNIIKQRQASNPEVATAIVNQGHYDSHEKAFTSEIQAAQKKQNAAKLTATQNIGAGLFVGGLKTASGVLFLVPGFNPNYNGKDDRSSHVTNDLLFASAICGLPAGTFSMLDTLRIQVRGELNRHKAAKEGKLPGQIAVARLKELDQMEQRLKLQ